MKIYDDHNLKLIYAPNKNTKFFLQQIWSSLYIFVLVQFNYARLSYFLLGLCSLSTLASLIHLDFFSNSQPRGNALDRLGFRHSSACSHLLVHWLGSKSSVIYFFGRSRTSWLFFLPACMFLKFSNLHGLSKVKYVTIFLSTERKIKFMIFILSSLETNGQFLYLNM